MLAKCAKILQNIGKTLSKKCHKNFVFSLLWALNKGELIYDVRKKFQIIMGPASRGMWVFTPKLMKSVEEVH